ncbi:MAG: hypothetical protein WBV94_09895 [Blastocatellia bacterium]
MKAVILALVFILTGALGQTKDLPRVEFELRLAEDKPASGLTEFTFEDLKLYLHEAAVITNKDVIDARVLEGIREGLFDIEIVLSPEGTESISKASASHIGKKMAILLNGEIKSAAIVTSALSSGIIMITGNFNGEQAERLAEGIRSK